MSRCRFYEAPFFLKLSYFKRRKELTSSITRKIVKKWRSTYKNAFQYNNSNALFKKARLMGPAVFDALSNKKKYLTLYSTVVECRCKYGKPSQEKDICNKIVISPGKEEK